MNALIPNHLILAVQTNTQVYIKYDQHDNIIRDNYTKRNKHNNCITKEDKQFQDCLRDNSPIIEHHEIYKDEFLYCIMFILQRKYTVTTCHPYWQYANK